MSDVPADVLAGGFADAAPDAARCFRAILDAMARPGRIVTLDGATAPAPASPALAAVLLTLTDATTPLYLAGAHDCAALRDWLRFQTGAQFASRAAADFALGTWDALMPLAEYRSGTAEYPDRSATLIVELPRLEASGARLTGPGIEEAVRLSLPQIAEFAENARRFPLGLDFMFTCGNRLAALPRTTRVEAG